MSKRPFAHPCALLLAAGMLALPACKESQDLLATRDGAVDASILFPETDAVVPPPPDRVAACDQAADGTPCGDADEWHCVFGVCAENLCGDGVLAGVEQCDDGNDFDGDGCPANCKFSGVCRDGVKDEGEECDDGNRENVDTCSNSCLEVVCGNRRQDPGEECDDGNKVDSDTCSSACRSIACGNMRVDPGEACDGQLGCTVEGQACNRQCTACVDDRCGRCTTEKCSLNTDVDLLPGCRERISPIIFSPESGNQPSVENFNEKCAALDDCIRANPSCVHSNGYLDTGSCFCGSQPVAVCQSSSEAPGPCAQFYGPATDCPPGETFNACVLGANTDLTFPAGWAYFLAECRYTECKSECGYP